jgi:microcystin-dependent protein
MGTPFFAELRIFSFNFPPKNWAFCNGQFLPINQNQALFSLLGTTYGGNGQTTFALPDLRGRTPLHFGNGFIQGERGGQESHAITISELPAHTHQASGSPNAPNQGTPLGGTWAAIAGTYSDQSPNATLHPASISGVGGSQPHNNLSPYLVLNFCISLQGIFPSQN